MSKKKKLSDENKSDAEKVSYDFGFGLIDPEKSDFATLARGIGLDPDDLASFLSSNDSENKKTS